MYLKLFFYQIKRYLKYYPPMISCLASPAFCSWRNDTNVILADEMGLGKTVQSVSMLGFLQVSAFFFFSWFSFMKFLEVLLS